MRACTSARSDHETPKFHYQVYILIYVRDFWSVFIFKNENFPNTCRTGIWQRVALGGAHHTYKAAIVPKRLSKLNVVDTLMLLGSPNCVNYKNVCGENLYPMKSYILCIHIVASRHFNYVNERPNKRVHKSMLQNMAHCRLSGYCVRRRQSPAEYIYVKTYSSAERALCLCAYGKRYWSAGNRSKVTIS